jgi:hypothetical protein
MLLAGKGRMEREKKERRKDRSVGEAVNRAGDYLCVVALWEGDRAGYRSFPLVSVQQPAAHTPGCVLRSHVGSGRHGARSPVAGRVRARGLQRKATLLHPPSLLRRRLVKREGKEGPSLLSWVGLVAEPDGPGPVRVLRALVQRGRRLGTRSTRFRCKWQLQRVACQFASRWLFFNGD